MTHEAERREAQETTQSRWKGREEKTEFVGEKTRRGEKGEPRRIARNGTTTKRNTHNRSAQGGAVEVGVTCKWICATVRDTKRG